MGRLDHSDPRGATRLVYPAEPELTLRDLLQVVRRRLPLVLLFTAIGFLLAAAAALVATRRFQATGTIQVEKESTSGLDLGSINGSTRSVTDALNSDIELQTQASILQSNALALRVIRRLQLQNTVDYKTETPSSGSPAGSESSPAAQAHLLGVFHTYLAVKPIGGTHLIDISYTSTDARLAANVVNGVVQELIDEGRETRAKSAEVASETLTRQLADLRVRSQELQAQVAQMQQQSGIYSIGTTDAEGHQQAYSAVLEQFQRAAKTLSDADENRILKKGIADAARSGNPEVLSSLAGNAATSGNVTAALSALQNLRAQQATVEAQLDQLKVKFGPGYPRVAELQANLASLGAALQRETARVGERAVSDYDVAMHTYEDARRNYEEQKGKADALNNRAINYIITRQEADESRALYEDLLRRLKEAGILEDLKSSTITVIDPALVPPAPSKPSRKLYLVAGLFGGLFLGVAVVLLRNLLSDKLEDASDLRQLGLTMPAARARPRGRNTGARRGEPGYEDAVRSLRSAITRAVTGEETPVILLGTVSPRESLGTLASDLAESYGHQGRRALLVQADLRSPGAAGGPPSSEGLYTILATGTGERSAIQSAGANFFILPRGPEAGNSSDLLDSDRMRSLLASLRSQFDVVVLAGPAALPFPETQVLAGLADVVVLRAQVGLTSRTAVERAYEALRTFSRKEVLTFLDEDARTGVHHFYGFRSQQEGV